MRNKVLFILHYCPPVYGSNVVGSIIKESKSVNTFLKARFVKIKSASDLDKVGHFEIKKLYFMVELIITTIFQLIFFHPDKIYLTPSIKGAAFFRDLVLSCIIKIYTLIFNKKIFYHYHAKGIKEFTCNSKMNLALTKFFLKNVNIILLSKKIIPDIDHFSTYSKVYFLNNGIKNKIDDITFSQICRARETSETLNILFLSNLKETKGVFVAYQAFKRVLQMNPSQKIKLNYVGGISESETKEKLTEMISNDRLSSNVELVGPKYGHNKNQFLSEAHIFLFPTYYEKECFPLVILESMQFGLPVLSTYEGGIPDMIEEGKNGYLVPQKNIEVLTQRLNVLITNRSKRIAMGSAARNMFLKNFQIEKFEDNLIKILNE